MMSSSRPPPVSVSSAVNCVLLRSLKEHYPEVSKMTPPPNCLHFLCGLYPDALGIHSVSMRPKLWSSGSLAPPSNYTGPVFSEWPVDSACKIVQRCCLTLKQEVSRDALHSHIEERAVDESLFPFLQAWLYVKDHRSLTHWFKRAGTLITGLKPLKDA